MGKHLGNYKKLIGKKIRDRRKELGFESQEALAIAMGTDQPRIAKWESGRNMPGKEHKVGLLKALKVDDSFFDIDVAPVIQKVEISKKELEQFVEKQFERYAKPKEQTSERQELINLLAKLNDNEILAILKIVRRKVAGNNPKRSTGT